MVADAKVNRLIMAVELAKRLINVNEYHTMAEAGILTSDDRVELIQGEIIEMSPIGNKHSSIVMRLINVLGSLVGSHALINAQNPIRIDDLNEPENDLLLLKVDKNYYKQRHPGPEDVFVLIEVSDSSYAYDKHIKSPLYASAGVPEYCIVNIEKRQIEVHKKPRKGAYKSWEFFNDEDSVSLDFCDCEINVKRLIS